jgi:Putative prokaryotic signal transducing protein
MNLVTVFSAGNPADAEVTRSRLEAAGFHPVVINETAAFTLGFFSPAFPVRVQVSDEEAEEAKQFLALGSGPPTPDP